MGLLSNFRNRSAAPEPAETEPPALDFDFDGPLPLDGSDDEWLQAAERRRPTPEAQETDPFLAGIEADVPAAGQPNSSAQSLAPAPDGPVPQVAPSVDAHVPIEHAAPATMLGAMAPPPPPPMMPMDGAPQFPTEAPAPQFQEEMSAHVESAHAPGDQFSASHAPIADAASIPSYAPAEQLPPQFDEDPPVAVAYASEPLAPASEPLMHVSEAVLSAPEPLVHAPEAALPAPEPLVSAPEPPSGPEPVHMEPLALSATELAQMAPVETYEFQSAPLAVPQMDHIAEDVHHIIEETVADEVQTHDADSQPPSPEPLPDLGIVFAGLSNAGITPTPPLAPAAAPLDISYGPIGPQAMPHLQTLGLTGGVSWHEVTVARRTLLGHNPADGSAEQQLRRTEVNLASATLRLLRVGPLLPA